MRRIIDRLAYDTDNAVLLGSWWNGRPIGESPLWETQKLYRKSTGEYFLVCNGGYLIKHDRKVEWEEQGNHHGWIVPLEDKDDAIEWSVDHLPIKEVENLFGKFPETRDRGDGWNFIPPIPVPDLPSIDDKEDEEDEESEDDTKEPSEEEEKENDHDNKDPEDTDFDF